MTKYYIRFGEIPENERSCICINGEPFSEEKGVSVYNAIKMFGKWRVVMPETLKVAQGNTYEMLLRQVLGCIEFKRKVYLVKGNFVGLGEDKEPLIRNVKIIKDITEQFLKCEN